MLNSVLRTVARASIFSPLLPHAPYLWAVDSEAANVQKEKYTTGSRLCKRVKKKDHAHGYFFFTDEARMKVLLVRKGTSG